MSKFIELIDANYQGNVKIIINLDLVVSIFKENDGNCIIRCLGEKTYHVRQTGLESLLYEAHCESNPGEGHAV